ncbi:helix-turn-helix transcriptional regulator [Pedobacter frigoris]|uniref:helix-turn-helix domain-containing protein n=1 Tax=Pedobacter frigoris TaxID=2571272 RepID=UPI0029313CFF|nr:helix-turn-helix transcriptional regulator [Pedobacter frigoris]
MKSTGKIIYEVRMKKGLSQEELAEMAKVNLRTIQRIENDLTEPRETTINLIFGVLEIDQNELKPRIEESNFGDLVPKLIDVVFIILLNVTIAAIIIYLTVYDNANIYSRTGNFFLCILIPYFIVSLTRNSTSPMRLIKFGTGFILAIIFALFQLKIAAAVFSGLIPFSLMALSILFYGNSIQLRR